MWSVLFLTLPTRPSSVRLRIWRSLKALGCAAIRDGVYLLPQAQEPRFVPLVDDAKANDGQARVLDLSTRDERLRAEIVALFDRSDAYGQWRGQAQHLAASLASLEEDEARRRLRAVVAAMQAIRQIDYYPGEAANQAQVELEDLQGLLEARFSAGEPQASPQKGIERLDKARFSGRCWATRERPWVDRMACAWLIRRFIDPQARFLWLASSGIKARLPRGALGFDFDGARFTHVGALVSFEVLLASFGLSADPALQRLARAVHFLDVGGIPVPEAAGLEAVLSGLRELHANDDQLMAAAGAVFDALYAASGGQQ